MDPEKQTDVGRLSDEDLALALKGGSDAAFEEIVRRYQGRVYAVAYRITTNREDALDVTQEALLKVYQKIDSWQPTGGFLPWMLRLTSNQAIDHLRRVKRKRHQELDESALNEYALENEESGEENTAKTVWAKEIADRVDEALVVLSPTQRAVFVMRHYEGLALNDIAESLNCTVGSVKVHLFRAMRKLQKALQDMRDEES
ncbi:MAG: RNA polymerase sigma factor [Candidatus Hydrogenedentota bacterium]